MWLHQIIGFFPDVSNIFTQSPPTKEQHVLVRTSFLLRFHIYIGTFLIKFKYILPKDFFVVCYS